MQVLASQLHFLANRNAGLAIPPLFWPVNCIKIGGHVALLSGPAVHSLYCVHPQLYYTEEMEKSRTKRPFGKSAINGKFHKLLRSMENLKPSEISKRMVMLAFKMLTVFASFVQLGCKDFARFFPY